MAEPHKESTATTGKEVEWTSIGRTGRLIRAGEGHI